MSILPRLRRAAALIVLIGAAPTFAAELHVPAQFATIQAAIDAANNADEIIVDDGVYAEAIDFTGKMISVRSVNGPDTTTVNAFGLNAPVVTMIGVPAGAELTGFTLTGGHGLDSKFSDLGGGVYLQDSSPIVRDCVLRDQTVNGFGGGVYISGGAPSFAFCTLLRNIATQQAGGMYVTNTDLTLSHCQFLGNIGDLGAGVLSIASNLDVINCLFSGNGDITTSNGGALYSNNSVVSLLNTTFVNNTAVNGRALASVSSTVTVDNSIIWGDQVNQVSQGSSSVTYQHCIVRGSGGSGMSWNLPVGIDGGSNLDVDPRFQNARGADNVAGTLDDDARLFDFSPGIDAGRNDAASSVQMDLDAATRFLDDPAVADTGSGDAPIIDLGAYEFQFASMPEIIHVALGESIQNAFDSAHSNAIILLAPGEHIQTLTISGKHFTIQSADPGSPATISPALPNLNPIVTVLGPGAGLTLSNVIVTNHLQFGPPAIVCDDGTLVITDSVFDSIESTSGSAITCSRTELTIADSVFSNNRAADMISEPNNDGGAIYASEFSEVHIANTIFSDNVALNNGGAIRIDDSTMHISGSTFLCNEVGNSRGGSIFTHSSDVEIDSSTFEKNSSLFAGGISVEFGSLAVSNSLFYQNDVRAIHASTGEVHLSDTSFIENGPRGAVSATNRMLTVARCQFLRNSGVFGQDAGGSIRSSSQSGVQILETTFVENEGRVGGAIAIVNPVGDVEIRRTLFARNNATVQIGAAFMEAPPLDHETTISECVFIENSTYGETGALQISGNTVITECLFASNSSNSNPSAILIYDSTSVAEEELAFQNNIIYGNALMSSFDALPIQLWGWSTVQVAIAHSDVQSLYTSEDEWNLPFALDAGGNIDADPLFRDPIGPDGIPGTGDEDYTLLPGSPCIDAGANDLVAPDFFDLDDDGDTTEPTPFDLRGLPRFIDDPGTPDSGAGVAPIVDIGPYEFQGVSVLADMNGDGAVNGDDLATLLSLWGPCPEGGSCRADLNDDGAVNGTDLAVLLANWN